MSLDQTCSESSRAKGSPLKSLHEKAWVTSALMIPAEDFPTWHNHPNHIVGFPPGTLRGARLHSFYAGRFWAQRKEALHRQVKRLSYGLIVGNLDPPNRQIPMNSRKLLLSPWHKAANAPGHTFMCSVTQSF